MTIYKEIILDHYQHPENHGYLDDNDAEVSMNNSTCGDTIRLTLKIKDGKVDDVRFDGNGCAISVASASLLTEYIKGMKTQDIMKLDHTDILKLLNIELTPTRLNCATLPLKAIHRALHTMK